MLGLGLAASHAPSMFRSVELWPTIHRALTDGVPQPAKLTEETTAVIQGYIDRIDKGFKVLGDLLKTYRPDALIVVGDDQAEVFTAADIPSFCLFTCSEVRGTLNMSLIGEPEEENHITIPCHSELATYLFNALIREGFDLCQRDEVKPPGKPNRGMGHAFTRPVLKVIPDLNVPVINLHVNAYFPPLPSARQCYGLGQAMARILAERPERVAIMASGGLSHDPKGPRAGWIDTSLDHWVLDQLRSGNAEALSQLFTVDSDTFHGGTGEIRAWIVAAGACAGRKATIVDYIPAHHAVTGLGFAYWSFHEVERVKQ